MVPDGSCIVVHLVGPKQVGQRFPRTRLGWPLHITLAPWFTCTDEPAMTEAVEDVARHQPAFTITVGNDALFGVDRDIPVSLIATEAPCKNLHTALVALLRTFKVSFASERYTGLNYRPHITHHDNHRRHSGDVLAVGDITLVRLIDHQTCEIIRHFALGRK